MDLFRTIDDTLYVTIRYADGSTKEEEIALYIADAWKQCLPHTTVTLFGDYSIEEDYVQICDEARFEFHDGLDYIFTDAYLEIEEVGKETKTIDFKYTPDKSEYSFSIDDYLTPIHKDAEVYVYLTAVDSFGFTHKTLLWNNIMTDTGYSEQIFNLSEFNLCVPYHTWDYILY